MLHLLPPLSRYKSDCGCSKMRFLWRSEHSCGGLKRERAEERVRDVSWESGKKFRNGEMIQQSTSTCLTGIESTFQCQPSTLFLFLLLWSQVQFSLPVQFWGRVFLPFPVHLNVLSIEKIAPWKTCLKITISGVLFFPFCKKDCWKLWVNCGEDKCQQVDGFAFSCGGSCPRFLCTSQ